MPGAGTFIPFKGFTPSVDPTVPGAILNCSNLVPTLRGMRAGASATPFGNPAFPAATTGAATVELLTGANRTLVGTGTDLFEVSGHTNTNVSSTAGVYTGAANRWRFVQFGNATVATNGADALQQSISSGNFTAIGSVLSATVKVVGTGYTSAPTVVFAPPAKGGRAATGTASIASGAVSGITIDDPGEGYAYDEIPPITFSGGGGSGAAATAVMQSAPIANILEVVQGFVFALGTSDPVNGSRPHGWWCSGLYDQTNWTPDQATQCENGIIVDQPGPITAGKALGTNIIVYKAQSMFYGVYEGPPVVWAFNQISPIVGTPAQECVVQVGSVHYFLGTDKQVYVFDGTIPQPIGDEVHDWLSSTWSSTYQANVQSYHDEPNSLIYWYFASSNSQGAIDTCLVYNYRTGKFGRADLAVECVVQAISGQITWDDMGSLPGVSTWDTLPQIPYNSSYWTQSAPAQGFVDTTHTLQGLNGVAGASSLTTGWMGDDYSYTDWLGFVPRFMQIPSTATGTAYTQSQLGMNQSPQSWPIGPYYDGELACDFSSRYCQVTMEFTGNHEILGATPRVAPSGEI